MNKSELIKNALLIASHTQSNPEYEELLKQFDDFVLVPKEPTWEMINAGENACYGDDEEICKIVYKTMIKEGELK